MSQSKGVRIIFDGPPGPTGPRFIEVENDAGRSICAGEWRERHDGKWALMIDPAPQAPCPADRMDFGQIGHDLNCYRLQAEISGDSEDAAIAMGQRARFLFAPGGQAAAPPPAPQAGERMPITSRFGNLADDPTPQPIGDPSGDHLGDQTRGCYAPPCGGQTGTETDHVEFIRRVLEAEINDARTPGWRAGVIIMAKRCGFSVKETYALVAK